MRELKDFELGMVTGGQVDAPCTLPTLDIKHMQSSTIVEPFLLGEPKSPQTYFGNNLTQKLSRPQRNLQGALKQHPRQGGPFTFKTPYLNR